MYEIDTCLHRSKINIGSVSYYFERNLGRIPFLNKLKLSLTIHYKVHQSATVIFVENITEFGRHLLEI